MSEHSQLIQMANDIGNFFRAQSTREEAVSGIENHIRSFWTRRMREKIRVLMESGESGLDELPRAALDRLIKDPNWKPKEVRGGDAG